MTAPPPPQRQPFWTWGDAALFVCLIPPSLAVAIFLSMGVFGLLSQPPGESVRLLGPQFVFFGVWLGALWLLLKIRHDEPFWASMAWRIPWPHMSWTVWLGPVLVLAVALLGEAMHTPEIENPIQRLLRDKWSILVVAFFGTTLGPLAEELVFRGFLQPLMTRTFGMAAGIALASLPFSLAHGPQYSWSWRHILLLFLASVVFGAVRWRTGSTAASTLVHATYNLTFLAGYLLQRKDLLN